MNVLFVCTGNTCRSPIAEGYLSHTHKGLNADSCGLSEGGMPISQNSKTALAEIGIDKSQHISKPISKELVSWADRIICMSHSHKEILNSLGVECEVLGNGIPDPYGCDITIYRQCRDEIIKQLDLLFPPLKVISIDYRHVKDIARLEEVCFSCPWSEQTITDAYKTGTRFFVAEKNGAVLGYVGISAIIDEGYITNIAVFPEYRNMGVATALLENLFQFAKQNGLSFISLEVRESNSPAISLYEKFGFLVEGKRKNFYSAPTEDALIMTKRFE
jgi:ribosomal-protein-alanine N-acetyltransferase